jgi:hypothetical protein
MIHLFFVVLQSSANIRPLSVSHHIQNIFQSFSWLSSGMMTLQQILCVVTKIYNTVESLYRINITIYDINGEVNIIYCV